MTAILVLEDGRTFRGETYGAPGTTVGEAVFSTGMTGYQETLTDPSYAGQIVAMTAPHVGNTGVNGEDDESRRMWVAGFVVRDPARRPANWRATGSLDDELVAQGVVGISGIDTRALTRHLRDRGAMRAGISTELGAEELLAQVTGSPSMSGADLAPSVSASEPYVVPAVGEKRFTIAALDLGIKTATPRALAELGVETHVLPARATAEQLLEAGIDGVFVSNGPGDPAAADYAVEAVRGVLEARRPLFGICFGNQILGRALGLGTYKLRFGHRGLNQPVLDRVSGTVRVTSHNHGFAVDAPLDRPVDTPFGPVEVSHVGLNDDVVEGLRLTGAPAFSVQFHPEAAAGPHDANPLFGRFVDLMAATREGSAVTPAPVVDSSTGEKA
ncbi:glutamine-hydrolyzing carbamoyl-phosphate synthase small subunit [Modestobacter altitudinis]|uniref:glutamine-hydrolyzing carbamoyl-phosphate synthase small subunit n=1 Tax=Modestobacter altitudinis TaxID=2213158 RepID=UPI001FE5F740|nr:glutamine-hydrolyzing carbamoyl-phosphate synthase small subunit [Modestobacter altitudinis]